MPRSVRRASARPRSVARSRGRSGASSSASRSAACATRRRSAATDAPTSARCRAASSRRSRRRAPTTRSSCSTRSTSSGTTFGATRRRRCSRCSIPSRTTRSRDHYLEVPFDLSHVMFIATANVIDPIPAALSDRLEILELPGYTRDEKRNIARQFLVPKQLEEHGLKDEQLEITDEAVSEVIDSYTREAGVRNLEREIGIGVPRRRRQGRRGPGQGARGRHARGRRRSTSGRRSSCREVAERTAEPGVATGLAWTPVGGDILFIEATKMPGKGIAGPHRSARRRDEGVGAGGAVVRARQGQVARHRRRTSSRRPTSTCTSRRARSRRTVRRRASRCSRRWCRC